MNVKIIEYFIWYFQIYVECCILQVIFPKCFIIIKLRINFVLCNLISLKKLIFVTSKIIESL